MNEAEKERLIKKDIESIENRVRHAFNQGYEMGMKAYKEQSGDAINRQAMLNGLANIAKAKAKSDAQKSLMGRVMFFTEQLPSVNSQQRTGHWISDVIQGEIDGQIVKGFTCSKCGAISVFRITGGKIVNGDLCPNCGAKMVESEVQE